MRQIDPLSRAQRCENGDMSDFKNLLVWQKAYALSLDVHRVAGTIRRAGHLSMKNQIIRAASSIPANIVEGRGQESSKEFARYLRIALNSGAELEFHLMMAKDLNVIGNSTYLRLLTNLVEVKKMLHGLLNSVRSRSLGYGCSEV